jgi:hypothetical protein
VIICISNAVTQLIAFGSKLDRFARSTARSCMLISPEDIVELWPGLSLSLQKPPGVFPLSIYGRRKKINDIREQGTISTSRDIRGRANNK